MSDVRKRYESRRESRKAIVCRDSGFCKGAGSAWVAQLVERVLGKDEVTGSIPVPGSRKWVGFPQGGTENRVQIFVQVGGGNSTVESHSSKVMVAGSNPVPRSRF